MPSLDDIKRIAKVEFADIVKDIFYVDYKLRIVLINDSFLDVYLSQKLPDRFGFHWECKDEAGSFYRYDNVPDKRWKSTSTFPFHFHEGAQDSVSPSPFPLTTIDGFRAFMEFIRNKMK
jgi:hypothetical protein